MKIDKILPFATGDSRDAARAAQEAGYDGVFAAETQHDPLLTAGMAASVTSEIQVGTAITVAFARNPMSLAVSANDVQLLSQGRFLLGLGSQVRPHITRRFSMPWSHPAPRMREFILAMRAIWDTWNGGEPLAFDGEFYTHTLMTPMFSPAPNPYGPPPVLLAGVGAVMTEVAGEVADGFLCHGFTTERYIREVTVPALERGAQKAGRDVASVFLAGSPFIVTGGTDAEVAKARKAVCAQIAFYASTPAYRPVLELHGWGELQAELTRMSKEGRWDEMGALIDDDMLATFAVVAEPDRVAGELRSRYGDLWARLTLYMPYEVDESVVAPIAADLRAGPPTGS